MVYQRIHGPYSLGIRIGATAHGDFGKSAEAVRCVVHAKHDDRRFNFTNTHSQTDQSDAVHPCQVSAAIFRSTHALDTAYQPSITLSSHTKGVVFDPFFSEHARI